jgi:hypothetical protein
MADEDDKVALVDLDGSIVDYDKVMKQELEKLRHPDEPPVVDRYMNREQVEAKEAPHLEARRKLIQAKPGFWRTLPKHPLGFEIIEDLRHLGFLLHVLTKGPGATAGAWTEKYEWCRDNLPDAEVTVTQNKALSYGRVLVDDWPPYFLPWLKHRPRGQVVCVAQPWNVEYATGSHSQVFRYDGTNRTELRMRLHQAFNRPARGE